MASPFNVPRLLAGGALAGVILIGLNLFATVLLGERFGAEMNAWLPGAAERMRTEGAAVALGLVMKLLIGITLVGLYAAARPRFGPGPRTAALMALPAWLLGAIFFSDFALTGMLSWTTYALLEAMQLVAFVAAGMAGAWVYRE